MKYLVSLISLFILLPVQADVKKLSVFVGIPPQAYFVKQIAGDLVYLETLMPATQNPVTYEPRPHQLKGLYDADVFFMSGVPFEQAWFNKNQELKKNIRLVNCCETFKLLKDIHEHSHDEIAHSDFDPHYWTSPKQGKLIARTMFEVLLEYLPEHEVSLQNNYDALINELNSLNEYIHSQLTKLDQRRFMISHPAWAYFANDYGLEQISLEQNGKSIRARQIIKYIELAKSLNMQAVFAQPQFNQEAADLIAKGANIKVLELDPMHEDYINNLYQVTDKLVLGLK